MAPPGSHTTTSATKMREGKRCASRQERSEGSRNSATHPFGTRCSNCRSHFCSCSANAIPQQSRYGLQTRIGLRVESISRQVPLDSNHEDQIAPLVPVTAGMRDGVPAAQLGDLSQSDSLALALWEFVLDRAA